jgi:hypothetical protein
LPTSLAAGEPADEEAAGVAARVELAGGDHVVVDPARGKGFPDRLDHVLLGHLATSLSVVGSARIVFANSGKES